MGETLKHTKYGLKNKKNRDCTKCKRFGGLIGKNYFVCYGQMFEDQEEPACHDIYDRDVLFKGSCTLFVPKEIDLDDDIHDHDAVERTQQKDVILIPYKE